MHCALLCKHCENSHHTVLFTLRICSVTQAFMHRYTLSHTHIHIVHALQNQWGGMTINMSTSHHHVECKVWLL